MDEISIGVSEPGRLVIGIPIELLAFAVQNGPDWPDGFRITDPVVFARSVAERLRCDEDEDGTTALHRALDAAAISVIEHGDPGIEETIP